MTQHIYLVNTTYNEEKNEIICYFENNKEKIAKRFKFFPYINLPQIINENKIIDLLKFYEIKNFILQDSKITAKKFQELLKISNLIAKLTNKKIICISPERNFLIENNWSYFDSFIINENSLEKVDYSITDSNLIFKEIPFFQALKLDEENTNFILKKAVLSNLLKISIEKVPKNINAQTEILLENIFFKNKEFISWSNEEKFYSSFDFNPYGNFDKISEIDFSLVWVKLITNEFFNIGRSTINCNCCKPVKLEDENLLPLTTIEVKIKEDNLFFESSSKSFSSFFHKENEFKNERIKKRKEFFLKSIPIGPLRKDFIINIPLIDAKKLINEEKAVLSKNHKIYWHCKKEESFLSFEIKKIINELLILKEEIDLLSKKRSSLSKSFEELYLFEKIKLKEKLLYEIPFVLSNPSSAFFSVRIAKSIITIQEAIITKFSDFSEKNGYRIIHTNKRNVFVRGYSPLILAKNFAKELKLPMPIISSFMKNTSFR